MRRSRRILGTLLLVVGVLTLAWVVAVWRWQDPFTALYTRAQQSRLSDAYARRAAAFRPARPELGPAGRRGGLAGLERRVAGVARAYRRTLRAGDPVGRIRIGRIGVNMILVQGTDDASLKKGPGHYTQSALPGEGRLIYVAGHRTTYLAPFAYINNIRLGDFATVEVPYGTFTYRVIRHYIVPANAVRVLRNRDREILRLQACHPRFFATQRYIVDARLVSVLPRGGPAYAPAPTRLASSPRAAA